MVNMSYGVYESNNYVFKSKCHRSHFSPETNMTMLRNMAREDDRDLFSVNVVTKAHQTFQPTEFYCSEAYEESSFLRKLVQRQDLGTVGQITFQDFINIYESDTN